MTFYYENAKMAHFYVFLLIFEWVVFDQKSYFAAKMNEKGLIMSITELEKHPLRHHFENLNLFLSSE